MFNDNPFGTSFSNQASNAGRGAGYKKPSQINTNPFAVNNPLLSDHPFSVGGRGRGKGQAIGNNIISNKIINPFLNNNVSNNASMKVEKSWNSRAKLNSSPPLRQHQDSNNFSNNFKGNRDLGGKRRSQPVFESDNNQTFEMANDTTSNHQVRPNKKQLYASKLNSNPFSNKEQPLLNSSSKGSLSSMSNVGQNSDQNNIGSNIFEINNFPANKNNTTFNQKSQLKGQKTSAFLKNSHGSFPSNNSKNVREYNEESNEDSSPFKKSNFYDNQSKINNKSLKGRLSTSPPASRANFQNPKKNTSPFVKAVASAAIPACFVCSTEFSSFEDLKKHIKEEKHFRPSQEEYEQKQSRNNLLQPEKGIPAFVGGKAKNNNLLQPAKGTPAFVGGKAKNNNSLQPEKGTPAFVGGKNKNNNSLQPAKGTPAFVGGKAKNNNLLQPEKGKPAFVGGKNSEFFTPRFVDKKNQNDYNVQALSDDQEEEDDEDEDEGDYKQIDHEEEDDEEEDDEEEDDEEEDDEEEDDEEDVVEEDEDEEEDDEDVVEEDDEDVVEEDEDEEEDVVEEDEDEEEDEEEDVIDVEHNDSSFSVVNNQPLSNENEFSSSFIGSCEEMCPEVERNKRISTIAVSKFEMEHKKIKGSFATMMVKEFKRSSADNDDVLRVSEWVRTPDCLYRTIRYIENNIMEKDKQGIDPRFCRSDGSPSSPASIEVYLFIFDRYRMISKDFILQNNSLKKDAIWVESHERMARWYILMDHQMKKEELYGDGNSRQNQEQLNNLFKTLNEYYKDPSLQYCTPNKAEFISYYLIMQLGNAGEVAKELRQLPRDIINSDKIKFVTKLWAVIKTGDYSQFFSMLKIADPFQSSLMHSYVGDQRLSAIKKMLRSYNCKDASAAYPISDLTSFFMFDDDAGTVAFLNHCGIEVVEHNGFLCFMFLKVLNIQELLPLDANGLPMDPPALYMNSIYSKYSHIALSEVCQGILSSNYTFNLKSKSYKNSQEFLNKEDTFINNKYVKIGSLHDLNNNKSSEIKLMNNYNEKDVLEKTNKTIEIKTEINVNKVNSSIPEPIELNRNRGLLHTVNIDNNNNNPIKIEFFKPSFNSDDNNKVKPPYISFKETSSGNVLPSTPLVINFKKIEKSSIKDPVGISFESNVIDNHESVQQKELELDFKQKQIILQNEAELIEQKQKQIENIQNEKRRISNNEMDKDKILLPLENFISSRREFYEQKKVLSAWNRLHIVKNSVKSLKIAKLFFQIWKRCLKVKMVRKNKFRVSIESIDIAVNKNEKLWNSFLSGKDNKNLLLTDMNCDNDSPKRISLLSAKQFFFFLSKHENNKSFFSVPSIVARPLFLSQSGSVRKLMGYTDEKINDGSTNSGPLWRHNLFWKLAIFSETKKKNCGIWDDSDSFSINCIRSLLSNSSNNNLERLNFSDEYIGYWQDQIEIKLNNKKNPVQTNAFISVVDICCNNLELLSDTQAILISLKCPLVHGADNLVSVAETLKHCLDNFLPAVLIITREKDNLKNSSVKVSWNKLPLSDLRKIDCEDNNMDIDILNVIKALCDQIKIDLINLSYSLKGLFICTLHVNSTTIKETSYSTSNIINKAPFTLMDWSLIKNDSRQNLIEDFGEFISEVLVILSESTTPFPLISRINIQDWIHESMTTALWKENSKFDDVSNFSNNPFELIRIINQINLAIRNNLSTFQDSVRMTDLLPFQFPSKDFSDSSKSSNLSHFVKGALFEDRSGFTELNYLPCNWSSHASTIEIENTIDSMHFPIWNFKSNSNEEFETNLEIYRNSLYKWGGRHTLSDSYRFAQFLRSSYYNLSPHLYWQRAIQAIIDKRISLFDTIKTSYGNCIYLLASTDPYYHCHLQNTNIVNESNLNSILFSPKKRERYDVSFKSDDDYDDDLIRKRSLIDDEEIMNKSLVINEVKNYDSSFVNDNLSSDLISMSQVIDRYGICEDSENHKVMDLEYNHELLVAMEEEKQASSKFLSLLQDVSSNNENRRNNFYAVSYLDKNSRKRNSISANMSIDFDALEKKVNLPQSKDDIIHSLLEKCEFERSILDTIYDKYL